MAALQTADSYLHGDVVLVGLYLFIFKRSGYVDTAGRPDAELALGLIVDIKQDITMQSIGSQVIHTPHAGLLVGGDEGFKRTVLQ